MSFFNKRLILVAICSIGAFLSASAQIVVWQHRPDWTEAEPLTQGLLRVEENGKFGLVRLDGTSVIACDYDLISEVNDGYSLLVTYEGGRGHLKGILNVENGSVVNPKESFSIDPSWPYFSEGLLPVEKNGKWGYLKPDGTLKIPCNYLLAFPFSFGLASVRFRDGNFAHIDAEQRTSIGVGVLKANTFKFASTFVQTEYGPMALVALKGCLYGRDLDGHHVRPVLPVGQDFTLSHYSYSYTGGDERYSLEFNEAWQAAKVETSSGTKNYQALKKPSFTILPVPSITSSLVEGGYDLRLNGDAFLAGQFEDAIPLTTEFVLVKSGGRWGILRISPYDSVRLYPASSSFTFSHGRMALVSIHLVAPKSISEKNITLRCLSEGYVAAASLDNDGKYSVLVPTDQGTPKFEVEIDDVRYQAISLPLQFSYRPGFGVWVPSSVKLNNNQVAIFNVTVSNTSSTISSPARIFVDGVLKKTIGPLSPKEKEVAQVSLRIDLGDEDDVTRTVIVEIKEEDCSPVKTSHTVKFVRRFSE